MLIVQYANLALRFLLELCLLAALANWGFQTGSGWLAKIGLGLGAPLLAAVIWGVFISPKADVPLPVAWWLLAQVVLFGAAAAGLAATDHPTLAWVLPLTVAINGGLMYLWGQ